MKQRFQSIFIGKQVVVFWLSCIFAASLFSIENLGGRSGIYSPYNVAIYFTVISFILFTVVRLFVVQRVFYSKWIMATTVVISLLLLFGLVNTQKNFALYYPTFIAGFTTVLFIFSLFQYRITTRQWRSVFLFICIVGFVQVLIALVQRFDSYSLWYFWTGYYPFEFHGRYVGSLQQVNMLQTFLAFTVAVSLYLISFRIFRFYPVYLKIIGCLFVLSATFIILSSGSRAGVLTLIVSLILVFIGRRKALFKEFYYFGVWITTFIIGLVLSLFFPGDLSAIDKFSDVLGGVDSRLYLFKTTWALFMEQPVFGYGLGGFNDAFVNFSMINGVPEYFTEDVRRFTHPHNEFLFWMSQSGMIAFWVLPIFGFWYVFNLFRGGWQKALTILGLLAPFLIETQISYPFTLSAIHLFSFFLLLFLGVQAQRNFYYVSFKPLIIFTAFSAVLTVWLITFYLSFVSVKSIFESYYFYNRYYLYKEYPDQEKQGYYKFATQHPSYQHYVKNDMRHMLMKAFRENNRYDLNQYLLWSQGLNLEKGQHADVLENVKKIHKFMEVMSD
ncbi:MAG: O-antigen ligase family protein [Thiomicrorhabdus chilensis]|uniref:O-antigen ligase family protein n=1 Tax=Thiomicrorhabdus chilensis TaxID=63656 RepID=UPI00299E2E40|nr:O-antigen ligase family protein [Thiomicrorhabdus chilensis]MDX1347186.1 O-antigen ligase family protein [Thiomicrorhabdus chilensis]